jgi:lipoprotein-anchoring transpeptidase ErfK/SrfK
VRRAEDRLPALKKGRALFARRPLRDWKLIEPARAFRLFAKHEPGFLPFRPWSFPYSNPRVYLRSQSKARKPGRESPLASLIYALLCIGLVGYLLWAWRKANPAAQPPPESVARAAARTNKQHAPTAALPHFRTPETASSAIRPVETVLEAQIALVRGGISPGSIDGVNGSLTRAALIAFQQKQGIVASGQLDARTKALLVFAPPAMTQYTLTSGDLGRLMPVPKTWLGKSEQTRLDFENILELLGEKAFSNPQLVRTLNSNVNCGQATSGTQVTIPQVEFPPIVSKAAFVRISLQECVLEAFDSESKLLVHFPCSIGRLAAERPAGQLHVTTIVLDPNYTFDPALFPESSEAQTVGRKLVLPPGPNNPVGVVWIGLDRPGYGIHGTPAPERVGRAESHGCFRLANWNARYLSKLVWVGMTVIVK